MITGEHPSKVDSVRNERISVPLSRKRTDTDTTLYPRHSCHLPGRLSVVLARAYRCGHSKAATRKDTRGNGPR